MPSQFFATFLEEIEARTEIEDCLKRFARAVDRQDWKLARALYHDGAFDDHGFFKGPPDAFLAHIAKMHEHQDHSMHFNTNVLIEFQAEDRAFVETYVLVLQRFRPGAANVAAGSAGLRNFASARYLDRFEKRNGEWRVAHRTLVFGDVQAEPMTEPMKFPPEFTVQKHAMDDPLYWRPATISGGRMSPTTRSKAWAIRFLEPWNAHDTSAVLRELPDDFEWQFTVGTEPYGAMFRGKEELREAISRLFNAVPDLHYDVVDAHGGDNHLVMELLVTGRNVETGAILNFQACDIVIFDGDHLKQKRSYRKVVSPAAGTE